MKRRRVGPGGSFALYERSIRTHLTGKAKAGTALKCRRGTKRFEDAIAQGGMRLRPPGLINMIPLDGDLTVVVDGRIIGTSGVSGMQSTQIAQAGAHALN